MAFVSAIRRFSRLKEIVQLLAREGFDEILTRIHFNSPLHLGSALETDKEKKKELVHTAVRLRRVMEDAGGAFTKVGQMLSLRCDLIPQEYCDEFSRLQDNVKAFPYAQVKSTIESEFKKPLKEIFASFEEKPVASASVGQVHKARLKSGEWVAVKIQRPQIERVFDADIDLLHYIAQEAEKYLPEIRPFKPQKIVQEFENYTKKEMDYLLEAKNIDIFYEKYKYSPAIKIPKVYWEYSSSKVLTMEFIEGKKISDVELSKEQKKKVALTLYKSFMTQVFDMHVFHADPHPGNIFYMKNGKIALLDFGIVGRISPDLSESVEMMLVGLVNGDLDILTRSIISIGTVEDIDEEKFKEDLFEAWGEFHGSSLAEINMKRFFTNTFDLGRKYNIDFPSNFVLLVKGSVTIESFAKQLYPESNFIEVCKDQVKDIVKKEKNPSRIYASLKKQAYTFSSSLRRFPQDLRSVMHILKTGAKVQVEVDHKELNELTVELDRSSNRITFGLIIGGLIIATGLLIVANVEPKLLGIPAYAWGSISLIVIMALVLCVSILREKKEVN